MISKAGLDISEIRKQGQLIWPKIEWDLDLCHLVCQFIYAFTKIFLSFLNTECRNVSSCFFEIGSPTQTSQNEAVLVQMDHFELLLRDSCISARSGSDITCTPSPSCLLLSSSLRWASSLHSSEETGELVLVQLQTAVIVLHTE